MAKIIPFPGQSDRSYIHDAIQLYATGRWSRQQMMSAVARALSLYGVNRLPVRNYYVRLEVPAITSVGIFPVVIIEAQEKTYKRCPVCGSDDSRYLAGEALVIKVWCMGCGSIYRKEVDREETCKSG